MTDALLVIGVFLLVGLFIGIVLARLWLRRRRRTFTVDIPPMDASNTTFVEDLCPECGGFPGKPHGDGCSLDPVARLEALAGIDLVVYLDDDVDFHYMLKVPVDTLDSLAVLTPDLLVVIAQGDYPTIPKTRPGVGVVVLTPGPRLHISLERRQ